jgi:hypothetical protein
MVPVATRSASERDKSEDHAHSKEVDAGFASSLEERLKSEDTISAIYAWLTLEKSPVNVKRDAIISHPLDLLKDIEPKVGYGQSAIRLARVKRYSSSTGLTCRDEIHHYTRRSSLHAQTVNHHPK